MRLAGPPELAELGGHLEGGLARAVPAVVVSIAVAEQALHRGCVVAGHLSKDRFGVVMPKTAIQLDDQTVVADVLAGSPKTRLPDTAWQTMGALDPRGVDVFQWGFQTLGIGELSQHGSGA